MNEAIWQVRKFDSYDYTPGEWEDVTRERFAEVAAAADTDPTRYELQRKRRLSRAELSQGLRSSGLWVSENAVDRLATALGVYE